MHSGDSIVHDRQGLMLCDMATPKWAIYLVNDAWHRTTGISQEMAAGGHFWDLFEAPAPAQASMVQRSTAQACGAISLRCCCGGRRALPPAACTTVCAGGRSVFLLMRLPQAAGTPLQALI